MADAKDKDKAPLTPVQKVGQMFGGLTGFVASEGKQYTTEEGYSGQRIARAFLPFLLNGQPSGLTMPVNVNRLVNADGEWAISVSFGMIGASRDGKGGTPVINGDRELTNAVRDHARVGAETWYTKLSTAELPSGKANVSKPRIVFHKATPTA